MGLKLSSAFHPSKCTYTAVSSEQTQTHREHIPGAVGSQCCVARGAVEGSVPCSRVSHEEGESAVYYSYNGIK